MLKALALSKSEIATNYWRVSLGPRAIQKDRMKGMCPAPISDAEHCLGGHFVTGYNG